MDEHISSALHVPGRACWQHLAVVAFGEVLEAAQVHRPSVSAQHDLCQHRLHVWNSALVDRDYSPRRNIGRIAFRAGDERRLSYTLRC